MYSTSYCPLLDESRNILRNMYHRTGAYSTRCGQYARKNNRPAFLITDLNSRKLEIEMKTFGATAVSVFLIPVESSDGNLTSPMSDIALCFNQLEDMESLTPIDSPSGCIATRYAADL
jgi:hypothetical protein